MALEIERPGPTITQRDVTTQRERVRSVETPVVFFARRLWTKVHQIKQACAGEIAVCNAVFCSTISCFVPEIGAIKLRSCSKFGQNFGVFRPPDFLGEESETEFYVSAERMSKFGDDRPSDLGD